MSRPETRLITRRVSASFAMDDRTNWIAGIHHAVSNNSHARRRDANTLPHLDTGWLGLQAGRPKRRENRGLGFLEYQTELHEGVLLKAC